MTGELALFDAPTPPNPSPAGVTLTAGRRLTIRQARLLAAGRHPLGDGLRLHPGAAPHDDRAAPGRRCGNCRFRRPVGGPHDGRYPKCIYGPSTGPGAYPRVTFGPATDVRAWWPACTDHEWGDPRLGPDAARWVPELAKEVPSV